MQDYYIVLQAVSIIRTKPQHMSGKVYAQVLNTKLTGSEKHWRSKVFVLRLNESLERAATCIRFLWPVTTFYYGILRGVWLVKSKSSTVRCSSHTIY